MQKIEDIRSFAAVIQERVQKKLGEGCQVELQEVTKNNGVVLQGLVIGRRERNVSPTIYLEAFWEEYQNEEKIADIVDRILKIYREDTPKEEIDMEFFRYFDKVKDRICYRLIHREKNRSLLEKIPHIELLDLAICFYYAYQGKELGNGSILIYDSHVAMWNTTVSQLLALAQDNTPRIFPWECRSMAEVIEEILRDCGETQMCPQEVPMRVLSNRQHIHGAACILYPGLLDRLAEEAEGNLYVLPSSVHEVILLKDKGAEDVEALKAMIAEVNDTQVPPEEILSANLYYFDCQQRHISIVS